MNDCWVWPGRIDPKGYGRTYQPGRGDSYIHRVAYEQVFGAIPDGLQIDHLCRNRACYNPAHLEAVTRKENILRGQGIPAQNARRKVCSRGHAFTRLSNGTRICRTCQYAGIARYREKKAALEKVA